ncbi:MAG: N-acetyltransferase [Sphingobacteriales bacterium]|nr:MAG: N-acetyltransferase [Sphingobacteriales bacterium]
MKSDLLKQHREIGSLPPFHFREAHLADIPGMQRVRNAVTENKLSDPSLVPDEDYVLFLTERGNGWVCVTADGIAGFAIADLRGNNIWALFIDPAAEGFGLGKHLHRMMLDWYFSQTKETVWLGTAPGTRAAGFYRKHGWRETGMHGAELKFEMTFADWKNLDQ